MGCSQSYQLRFTVALLVLANEVAASSDQHEHCAAWANSGECEANPSFMQKTCESSCSRVGTRWASDQGRLHSRCQSWVKAGECQTNADFMLKTCPSSCGFSGDVAPPNEESSPSPPSKPEARAKPARNVSRNLKEEQQRQQEEIKRRAEELKRARRQNKTMESMESMGSQKIDKETEKMEEVRESEIEKAESPEISEIQHLKVESPKLEKAEAKAKDAETGLKPWQMSAPADVDDETFQCMREKFEIARQLDDANAREQSVRERAEAAHGRASASEQRHRDCLKDLAEANQERHRMRAQQSEGLSEHYEQRVMELREQLQKDLAQETAKLQKECSKREFQLQELARVANKRADEAESQLAGRATGEERLQAEQRAAEHAQEAQAAEQARLKIEEAYRVESTKAAAREQELQERLAKAEARVQFLEAKLETGEEVSLSEREERKELVEPLRTLRCEQREAEALFAALQEVFSKTLVLLCAPFGGGSRERKMFWRLPPKLVKLLLWLDRPAESVLQGLAALSAGSSLQMKELCHVNQPGSAVAALAWLVACASLAVYVSYLLLRLVFTADLGSRGTSVATASSSNSMVQGQRFAVNHLAALFVPVTRFFDAFSVPEDVRRIAERRHAELGQSPNPRTMGPPWPGASGSEPEPEEIYRRPAALEALLAAEDSAGQESRPSPRFGADTVAS